MTSYMTGHIVEILTPVHVGSGKDLLCEYDYFIKGAGKDACAVIVDQASLFEELAQDSSKDITRLLSGTSKLKDLVGVAKGEGTYSYPLQLFVERGEIPKDKIRAHLKDAFFRPYLAGSSIKGAIRTALLADMIEQLGVQNPEIQRQLPTSKSNPKVAADDLMTFLFSSRPQKSQNYDFLRALQVSDVSFDTSHLTIAEVRWFNLVKEGEPPQTKFKWKDMGRRRSVDKWQDATGVYAEMLRPACQSTDYPLHLKFDTFLLADNTAQQILQWKDKLPCFPAMSNFQDLTRLLNQHARRRLEKETAFFHKYGYSPAQQACEKLLKQMEEKPDAGYLQLGWASGWRGMTGDWMDESTENLMRKLLRKLYQLQGKKEFEIFPKTRRLVIKEGQPSLPFGWIRIWSADSSGQYFEEQAREKRRQLVLEQAKQAQLKKVTEEEERRVAIATKQAEEEAQRRAQLSPLEREMLELTESKPSQEAYITWLQALKNGHWTTSTDQQVVARAIQQQMQIAKVWKDQTSAKKPAKDKDYQRTLEVLRYL